MRLLASVRADVSCLMLKAVKGLFAKRALVRPGELCSLIVHVLLGASNQRVETTEAVLVHWEIPLVVVMI